MILHTGPHESWSSEVESFGLTPAMTSNFQGYNIYPSIWRKAVKWRTLDGVARVDEGCVKLKPPRFIFAVLGFRGGR